MGEAMYRIRVVMQVQVGIHSNMIHVYYYEEEKK